MQKIIISILKFCYTAFIYLGAFLLFFISASEISKKWNDRPLSKKEIINGYFLEEHSEGKRITANVYNALMPIRGVKNFCVDGKYIHGSKQPGNFGEGYFIINTETNDIFITAQFTDDGSDLKEYQYYIAEYGLKECRPEK